MTEQPNAENTLLIGTIVAPFGVKGQVKMRALTSNIETVGRRVRNVFIGTAYQPHRISKAFEHKPGFLVLSLEGISDRAGADALRGADVMILAQDAPPLADDEYFLHDLPGLRVQTEGGEPVGVVRDYIETGANDVLVVAREGQPDVLIPLVHAIVVELNVAEQRAVIRPIPGLLDTPDS